MCKQGISTIENVGNCIRLMCPQADFRINAGKGNMLTVILPGASGVKLLIIAFYKGLPSVCIVPYPITELILYRLLFLLCKDGSVLIEYTPFLSDRKSVV